ncbi:hypothetical protein B0F90DRAFT_1281458 [Multifurca ochricompacta]|uniref:Uncharacterized protein n=1 Tax=Multifurca ochricompacta TaxID=376703 RepID=A0AAD4LXZ8_9AGAM|nr:hypothetical protein B0F90DRAFT_1281458 [Multifurca ochricompacta]
MIPLMPLVALAFSSIVCSAFIILRILHSILPSRSLSRRVHPLRFNRPSTRSLPPADKSYIWLALCDISALSVFLWEAFNQWFNPASIISAAAKNPSGTTGSASRLWIALTLRQTCFLIVSAIILIHVRLRKSVSFGFGHWMLWVPFTFLATLSTITVSLLTDTTSWSFRIGYIGYSSAIAALNTIIFGSLVGTLIIIKRNLTKLDLDKNMPSTSSSGGESVQKPQIALATEDIDAIREGSSWITSPASSRRRGPSISPFSYSTTRSRTSPEQTSITPPSIFPFRPTPGMQSTVPVLPRTPSPRRGDTLGRDFEPIRRRAQSLRAAALTLSSANSWITSSFGTHPTLSAWSYSSLPNRSQHVVDSAIASTPTRDFSFAGGSSGSSASEGRSWARRPVIAPVRNVRTVGGVPAGHEYAQSAAQVEKGKPSPVAPRSPEIEISVLRILAWLAGVWIPLLLALPYFICMNNSNLRSNTFTSTLLVISVTISSPILALNLLLRHPVPIPHGILGAPHVRHSVVPYTSPINGAIYNSSCKGKGTGTGQVTSRRHTTTTDMWLIKGDAIDGKSRFKRVLSVLAPSPKLSILPVSDEKRKLTDNIPVSPQLITWHSEGEGEVVGVEEEEEEEGEGEEGIMNNSSFVLIPASPPPTRAGVVPRRHSFHHYPHHIIRTYHQHQHQQHDHQPAHDHARETHPRHAKSLSLPFPSHRF